MGGPGVPWINWSGKQGDYNVMVIDLLGPSLEDLFRMCNRHFSLKTILMLADQLVSTLLPPPLMPPPPPYRNASVRFRCATTRLSTTPIHLPASMTPSLCVANRHTFSHYGLALAAPSAVLPSAQRPFLYPFSPFRTSAGSSEFPDCLHSRTASFPVSVFSSFSPTDITARVFQPTDHPHRVHPLARLCSSRHQTSQLRCAQGCRWQLVRLCGLRRQRY